MGGSRREEGELPTVGELPADATGESWYCGEKDLQPVSGR